MNKLVKDIFIKGCEYESFGDGETCPFYVLGGPSKCKYYNKYVFANDILGIKKSKWCKITKITIFFKE